MFINTFSNIYFRNGQFEFAPVFSGFGAGTRCLTPPFQQYFSYIVPVSFIGKWNRSTRKKPCTDLPQVIEGRVRVTLSFLCSILWTIICLFDIFRFGHCIVCSPSVNRFSLPLWYLQTLILAKETVAIGSWENHRHRLSELTNLIIQGFIEFTSLGWKCDFNKAFWR